MPVTWSRRPTGWCPFPREVSDDVAIAFGLNAITARQILTRVRPVGPGDVVLVHGAAGGVGTIVTDIATQLGARVLGTASAKKHDLVRERGAEPIDYRTEDFVARTHALTDGRGADLVIDGVGGENFTRSFQALAPTGTLVMLGVSGDLSGGNRGVLRGMSHPARLMLRRGTRRVVPFGIGLSPGSCPTDIPRDWQALLSANARGSLRAPTLGGTFPLEDVRAAHAHLESGSATGKLTLSH